MNAGAPDPVPGDRLPVAVDVAGGLVAGLLAWWLLGRIDAAPPLAVALGLGAVAGLASARRRRSGPEPRDPAAGTPDERADALAEDQEDPVVLEVGDVLDLHAFAPREVASIVDDWLDDCVAAGRMEVRVIHGKGIGVQRRIVREVLARRDDVVAFRHEGGNWGATCVELATREDER